MVLFCKPRVCGEKSSGSVCMPGHAGSPPRMRGKGYDVVSRLCRVRITPACAGKRARPKTPPLTPRDHPRMCGEKYKIKKRYPLEMGSPPHVRGKGSGGNGPLFDGGITPACAGKRFDQRRQFVESEDHPRMCGEKGGVLRRAPQRPGSPPHVRGKDRCTVSAAYHAGITPACAGKSWPPAYRCAG